MFTGLVETVGKVISVLPNGDVWRLDISAPQIAEELKVGDSVAILGACNTIIKHDSYSFSVEMMEETRNRTKLGKLKAGSPVNLERAMRLDSRLDGHIVAGHIDGTASVSRIEIQPNTRKYFFTASSELISGIVPKGSVAIDGVSLTVIDANEENFSVGIIPTTLADTTLSSLKIGDEVNIETDMIGKYITKFLETRFSAKNDTKEMKKSLTWDKLVEYGWS